MVYIELII